MNDTDGPPQVKFKGEKLINKTNKELVVINSTWVFGRTKVDIFDVSSSSLCKYVCRYLFNKQCTIQQLGQKKIREMYMLWFHPEVIVS